MAEQAVFKKMKPPVNIKILPVKIEDFDDIARFLQKYFFPEEPLNSSLERCPSIEEMPFRDIIQENMSYKAVNTLGSTEDNLVGVSLNKEVSIGKKKNFDCSADCAKRLVIYKFLEKLDEKSRLWEVVNNQSHFNIVIVSVRNNYRGLNIGKKLVDESLKLAKSHNYKFVAIECSSFYSSRFALQMGFELIGEIRYDEYRDENNEIVFKVQKPHVSLQKLIKRL